LKPLKNDRLREARPCQRLTVRFFPFSEVTPGSKKGRRIYRNAPYMRSQR